MKTGEGKGARGMLERLAAGLGTGPEPSPPPGLRASSVLVPLFAEGGGAHLLLTLRSGGLTAHGGQISFPGGAVEAGETFLQAACREAREEVGMRAEEGRFLGRLPSVSIPVSGFFVVPNVVFFARRPVLGPCSGEVAKVFAVSLRELRVSRREETYERYGRSGPWPVFPLPEGRLWGATALMADALLALLPEDVPGRG